MTDVICTADLAAETGVSRQMIGRWSREGLEDAAKVGYGKWDREKALQWIADRREDSETLNGTGPTSGELMAARIDLYRTQAQGAKIRNAAAESTLVLRTAATGAYSECQAEIIAAGDAWARDPKTEACEPLRRHMSEAAVIALKAELWHELRARCADSVRRVEFDLATGADVGAARIRLPGSVGG